MIKSSCNCRKGTRTTKHGVKITGVKRKKIKLISFILFMHLGVLSQALASECMISPHPLRSLFTVPSHRSASFASLAPILSTRLRTHLDIHQAIDANPSQFGELTSTFPQESGNIIPFLTLHRLSMSRSIPVRVSDLNDLVFGSFLTR